MSRVGSGDWVLQLWICAMLLWVRHLRIAMSSEARTVLRRLPVALNDTLNPWHLLWAHIMLLNKGISYLHSLGPAWRGAVLSTEHRAHG